MICHSPQLKPMSCEAKTSSNIFSARQTKIRSEPKKATPPPRQHNSLMDSYICKCLLKRRASSFLRRRWQGSLHRAYKDEIKRGRRRASVVSPSGPQMRLSLSKSTYYRQRQRERGCLDRPTGRKSNSPAKRHGSGGKGNERESVHVFPERAHTMTSEGEKKRSRPLSPATREEIACRKANESGERL